jgi:hypothetical protein
MTSRTA